MTPLLWYAFAAGAGLSLQLYAIVYLARRVRLLRRAAHILLYASQKADLRVKVHHKDRSHIVIQPNLELFDPEQMPEMDRAAEIVGRGVTATFLPAEKEE